METQNYTELPRTVADAPPQCDRDCVEAAVSAYVWEWGERGVCCALHQTLLTQTSQNVGRSVVFAPLTPPAPAPLTRDERTKLKGEVYALGEEIEDLKSRGLALYRENEQLTRQVQATTVRLRETSLKLSEANQELDICRERLLARDAEHGELVDELERLRTLQKYSESRT